MDKILKDQNIPTEEKKTLSRQILDKVFGYDFFICYRWADGRTYALQLARALEKRGYEVFLDSDDYLTGDNWKKIGAWTLKKTGQLILIATPGALENKTKETAVEREVRIFSETKKRIIPISFAPKDAEGNLNHEQSTIVLARGHSKTLEYISPETISITENISLLIKGPSDETIDRLNNTFDLVRQDKKRARTFGLIALLLLGLLFFSVIQYTQANKAKKETNNQFANYWNELSRNRIDENILEAFLFKVNAAKVTSSIDNRNLFLNQLIHLSALIPNQIINLTFEQGVRYSKFNNFGDRLIVITENNELFGFKLPEGEKIFIPDYVNENKISYYIIQPKFKEDNETIEAWLNWENNEVDYEPDIVYMIAMHWNTKDRTIYTPMDDGQTSIDQLITKNFSLYDLFEAEGYKDSIDTGELIEVRLLLDDENLKSPATFRMLEDGTVLKWYNTPNSNKFIYEIKLTNDLWNNAKIAAQFLITISNKELSSWQLEQNKLLWSLKKESNAEIILSPDNQSLAFDDTLYNVETGEIIGRFDQVGEPDNWLINTSLNMEGDRMGAWEYLVNSYGTELKFKKDSLSEGLEFSENDYFDFEEFHPWEVKPSHFISLLKNGSYALMGHKSSFRVYDIEKDKNVAYFYFSSNGPLLPALADSLIRKTIQLENNLKSKNIIFLLDNGAQIYGALSDSTIIEFRTIDGERIVNPAIQNFDSLSNIALSPNGKLWATIEAENRLNIWDTATGHLHIGDTKINDKVLNVSFSDNSKKVYIILNSGKVLVKDIVFDWPSKKPIWLPFIAEALTGLTINDNGEINRLSMKDHKKYKNQFFQSLKEDDQDDPIVQYLLERFGAIGE